MIMAKPKKVYVCQACGSSSHRWQGQCADCAEWNTLVERATVTNIFTASMICRRRTAIALSSLDERLHCPQACSGSPSSTAQRRRDRSGIGNAGWRRPGIGKSTPAAAGRRALAMAGSRVVYVSGEEAAIRCCFERFGSASRVRRSSWPPQPAVRDILTTLGRANGRPWW